MNYDESESDMSNMIVVHNSTDGHHRQADRNGRKWLKEMAVYAWKAYGMRIVVFEAHYNGKAETVHSKCVKPLVNISIMLICGPRKTQL